MKYIKLYEDYYYDQILDLYNQVGIEGMTEDEIQYLKSGGLTDLPKRFGTEFDKMKFLNDDELDTVIKIQKVIDGASNVKYVLTPYGSGFYKNILCKLRFKFNDRTLESLRKINPAITINNDWIYFRIPLIYLDYLSNIEKIKE